jgi:hypothetical protein
MTHSFALAAAAALGFSLAASSAQARYAANGENLNGWTMQGIHDNGIIANGIEWQGVRMTGQRQPADATQPAVKAVILPSGETIRLE